MGYYISRMNADLKLADVQCVGVQLQCHHWQGLRWHGGFEPAAFAIATWRCGEGEASQKHVQPWKPKQAKYANGSQNLSNEIVLADKFHKCCMSNSLAIGGM